MIPNKRKSYFRAIVTLVFTSLGIVSILMLSEQDTIFLLGIGGGALFPLGLGVYSYRRFKRGFSKKDLASVKRNKKLFSIFPLLGLAGALLAQLFPDKLESPFLWGIGLGMLFFLSLMTLLDNLWLKSIFIWNSKDERLKNTWLEK